MATSLVNSVSGFYLNQFYTQMQSVFQNDADFYYPRPRRVTMNWGLAGSSSSFSRSRRTATSTAITKPFSMRELLARVKVNIRRTELLTAHPTAPEGPG